MNKPIQTKELTEKNEEVPDNIGFDNNCRIDAMAERLVAFDKKILDNLPKSIETWKVASNCLVSVNNQAKSSAIHFCSPKMDTYFPELQVKARKLKFDGAFKTIPFKIYRSYFDYNSKIIRNNIYIFGVWWWYGRDKLAIEYRKLAYRKRTQKFIPSSCTGINSDIFPYIVNNIKEIEYLLQIPVNAETGKPTDEATKEQKEAIESLPPIRVNFLDKDVGLIQNDVTFTEDIGIEQ